MFSAAVYGWVTFFFSAHPLAPDGQRLIFFWGIEGDAVVGLTFLVVGLVGCAGLLLLLPSLIRRVHPRWLRVTTGWAAAVAAVAAAPFAGMFLLVGLLLSFGTSVREVAPDGRSIVVSQGQFDGDVVHIYTEYDDFHYRWYREAPELSGPRIITSENCGLESSGEALVLSRGAGTVTIHPDQRPVG
ncbi:hypothetical protein J2W14_002143 [Pseudarthrobacter oxydans]|uniref:hypothetical protein n=1 Tax=Pseudarthrobacter oxydans TaxID=1671 RepID=UPI0027848D23|nr:hypothetical protein [Pseudarthrobacter oxydans]MDP9982751.1 hypothetical protein [Pseudarthrobacter oxydans]